MNETHNFSQSPFTKTTNPSVATALANYYERLNYYFPTFMEKQGEFKKQIHLAARIHAADMAYTIFGCPVTNRGFSQFLVWILFGTNAEISYIKFLIRGRILCTTTRGGKIWYALLFAYFLVPSFVTLDFFRVLHRTTQMKKKWLLHDYWLYSDHSLTEIRIEWGIKPIK